MPARIYLIRHGETDYNKARRMQGWLDIPLNETGKVQARETADLLLGHQIHAIYSSDLARAQGTAKPIGERHQLQITLTTHLRERDMGIFTGWAWERERDQEKDAIWPEFVKARDQSDLDWGKHKGETLRQVTNRITTFLDELHLRHEGQSVVVVTHGGTINTFFEHLGIKASVEGFRSIGNGAVHVLVKQQTKYVLGSL